MTVAMARRYAQYNTFSSFNQDHRFTHAFATDDKANE
jgi:hypothetical protein